MATTSPTFTIRRQPFQGPLARQLVAEIVQELLNIYGEPKSDSFARTPLEVSDDNDAAPNDVVFFVAFTSASTSPEEAMGCVAVKLAPEPFEGRKAAELKRLYVRAAYRSFGVGQALIQAAEAEARSEIIGVELLLLETGVRQRSSLRLYERNGWSRRECFGAYADSGVEKGGFSMCFEKVLV